MKHFISCGFLIQSQNKFLLCHPSNDRTGSNTGDKGWGLPKGKLDSPEESKQLCALREVKEETTLDLIFLSEEGPLKIGKEVIYTTDYLTQFQGEQITKTINVFHAYENTGFLQKEPLSCPTMVIGTDIPEMDDYRWVTKEEALRICVRSIRALFENVDTYLQSRS